MDNRQIMMPFLSLNLLGQPVETHSYQFHQLAIGVERPRPEEYVHGQITTLKSASIHPIVQSFPLDMRSAIRAFRLCHGALGVANVWLHDRRAAHNLVTIRPRPGGRETDLVIRHRAEDRGRVADAIKVVRAALFKLGCFVPGAMTRVLQSGASVHYAGTIPMQAEARRFTCTPNCGSHDFRSLYFADGVTFPFLRAKNLTFTLMANAIRVGEAMNRDLQV